MFDNSCLFLSFDFNLLFAEGGFRTCDKSIKWLLGGSWTKWMFMQVGGWTLHQPWKSWKPKFCKVSILIHGCKIDENLFTQFLEIMVCLFVVKNGLADTLDPKPDFSRFANECVGNSTTVNNQQWNSVRHAMARLCWWYSFSLQVWALVSEPGKTRV